MSEEDSENMSSEEKMSEEENLWSALDGRTLSVLDCVFVWLCGRELSRAAAVCRLWRRAASTPALWRRLLLTDRRASLSALRVLARHSADGDLNPDWSWRNEFIRAAAGWHRAAILRLPTPGENGDVDNGDHSWGVGPVPILQHADLNAHGNVLAVAADDASVTVYIRESDATSSWRAAWRLSLRRRGWRSADRVSWAPAPPENDEERLLIAGPLALADRWEMLIVELSNDCETGRVLARASCSAGAAGCWASRDSFLSLELRLLAPRRAVTTLWLNAATQEAQSEYTGVSAPVLRIYNEAQAHISHITVAEVPTEAEEEFASLPEDAKYMRVALAEGGSDESTQRLVIAACGIEGGPSGVANALGCWWLGTLTVPPLVAALGGGLAERVARRRHAPRGVEPEPPPPTERELRALCSPPTAVKILQGRLLGLTLHPNGRCVWTIDESGHATCLALPLLDALRVLTTAPTDLGVRPHYVQPSVTNWLLASPIGGGSSNVSIWSVLSGAEYVPPESTSYPLPVALLPRTEPHRPLELMLLVGNAVHESAAGARPMPAAIEDTSTCDANRDAVAHRLEVSEKARRASYLKEVRERVPPPRPEPVCFQLRGPAECAYATDGRSYTVASEEKSGRCGPCRQPPKPCCVTLVPDNNCRPKGPGHVDPCAHRPKTIVSIDRTQRYAATAVENRATNTGEKSNPASSVSSPPPQPPPQNAPKTENLTTRIMKSLNLNRAKDSTKDQCTKRTPNKQASSHPPPAWCANMPPPKQASQRCRPPSPAERLRRRFACRDPHRRPALIPQRDCDPPRRKLHTAVRHYSKKTKRDTYQTETKDLKAEDEKLASMLKAREGLKEISRGRVACPAEECEKDSSAGFFELEAGPSAVTIAVNLGPKGQIKPFKPQIILPPIPNLGPKPPKTTSQNNAGSGKLKSNKLTKNPKEPPKSPNCPIARAAPNESWLSLKHLQKMVNKSRKKSDSAPTLANKAKAEPCKPPCAPRRSPCEPPMKPQNAPDSSPCGPKPVTPPTTSPCPPSQPANSPHHNTPPPAPAPCKPIPHKNPCHSAPPSAKPPCHPELKPDPPKNPCQPSMHRKTSTLPNSSKTAKKPDDSKKLNTSKKPNNFTPISFLPVLSSV